MTIKEHLKHTLNFEVTTEIFKNSVCVTVTKQLHRTHFIFIITKWLNYPLYLNCITIPLLSGVLACARPRKSFEWPSVTPAPCPPYLLWVLFDSRDVNFLLRMEPCPASRLLSLRVGLVWLSSCNWRTRGKLCRPKMPRRHLPWLYRICVRGTEHCPRLSLGPWLFHRPF